MLLRVLFFSRFHWILALRRVSRKKSEIESPISQSVYGLVVDNEAGLTFSLVGFRYLGQRIHDVPTSLILLMALIIVYSSMSSKCLLDMACCSSHLRCENKAASIEEGSVVVQQIAASRLDRIRKQITLLCSHKLPFQPSYYELARLSNFMGSESGL